MDKKKINEQTFIDIDREDLKHMDDRYFAKSVYQILHLTREAVRYYEKLGLIQPVQLEESGYRSFSVHDIEKLMWIDLYKKHGFHAKEIKQLFDANTIDEFKQRVHQKQFQLETELLQLQKKLDAIKQDQAFLETLAHDLPHFTIQEMPVFEVIDQIPSVASIMVSKGSILPELDSQNENYLANMIRCVSFDEHGYLDSQISYIKEVEKQEIDHTYIGGERCVYTPVVSKIHDTDTMGTMFLSYSEWLSKHKLTHKGMVYIRPRILIMGELQSVYLDCWVPIY